MNKKLAAFGCSFAVLAMSQVGAAQSGALSTKVDLTLRDAELLHALSALSLQTGLQFVIGTTDSEFGRINLALQEMTASDAIRYICEAAGAFAEQDENGVFIIRSGKPTAEIKPAVTQEIESPIILKKIRLMKADAAVVYGQIWENSIPQEHWMLRPVGTTTTAPQRRNVLTQPSVVDLQSGRTNNDLPVGRPQGIPEGAYIGAGSGPGIELPTQSAEQGGRAGGAPQRGGGGGGGLGGGFGGQGGGFGGQGGGFGGQGGGFGGQGGFGGNIQGGEGFVPEGIESVTYSPTDNAFIVQGTEEAIRKLQNLIEMFDVAPRQVHVDVKFVTTSDSVDKSLGIDWLYQRGTMFAGNRPGTHARTNDPVFLNYATGNIQTRLRTLLTEGWGRVVNNPSVTTMNNQQAVFSATTNTTVFVNQVISTAGGIVLSPQPQTVPVTNQLSVRPRINGDGTVTMGLQPQISDFGQLRRGPDGTEIPDTLTQFLLVVVRVKSGDTVALGGLTRKMDNSSRSKIPILSDLPIIGQLFQGRNSQRSTQELTVFVTPTILEDESYGGISP
jgi:type II secretory pathway component GspD/PulD (secretin)